MYTCMVYGFKVSLALRLMFLCFNSFIIIKHCIQLYTSHSWLEERIPTHSQIHTCTHTIIHAHTHTPSLTHTCTHTSRYISLCKGSHMCGLHAVFIQCGVHLHPQGFWEDSHGKVATVFTPNEGWHGCPLPWGAANTAEDHALTDWEGVHVCVCACVYVRGVVWMWGDQEGVGGKEEVLPFICKLCLQHSI